MTGAVILQFTSSARDGGKARIKAKRQRTGLASTGDTASSLDDLVMMQADPELPCAVCGQTGDCA